MSNQNWHENNIERQTVFPTFNVSHTFSSKNLSPTSNYWIYSGDRRRARGPLTECICFSGQDHSISLGMREIFSWNYTIVCWSCGSAIFIQFYASISFLYGTFLNLFQNCRFIWFSRSSRQFLEIYTRLIFSSPRVSSSRFLRWKSASIAEKLHQISRVGQWAVKMNDDGHDRFQDSRSSNWDNSRESSLMKWKEMLKDSRTDTRI